MSLSCLLVLLLVVRVILDYCTVLSLFLITILIYMLATLYYAILYYNNYTTVTGRPDGNAKIYGKRIYAQELLLGHTQPIPKATHPFYNALDKVISVHV